MKVAVVVQRYGEEVAGGAELHARYVAELLAQRHTVTVLTTTAKDWVSWAPAFPAGASTVNGIAVRRFPVEREREGAVFALAAARAFAAGHTRADELRYLEAQGPWAPALWRHLQDEPALYDAVVAFSYRYITTREAALVRPRRTLLVPTAERDPAVDLELSRELFRAVGAIAYNSEEEREMIHAASANAAVPGEVVGIGSRIPSDPGPDPARFRARHGIEEPYLLYVGRIDGNKGAEELFRYFLCYRAELARPLTLALIGQSIVPIPQHPAIRHLGFLPDQDKFDAIAGASVLLLPSRYESLSMVTLEAMALGTPPLVNGRCDVLRGQMRRSNAGLYYEGYEEFFESLRLLLETPRLCALLGRNGRAFYQARYADVILAEKYERLLSRLG